MKYIVVKIPFSGEAAVDVSEHTDRKEANEEQVRLDKEDFSGTHVVRIRPVHYILRK